MKSVSYSRDALKDLRRHGNVAPRIRTAIEQYATDPKMHANNVRLLTGSPFSRLRVGSFRVIFSEDDRAILVLKIGPRGGVYD